MGVNPAIPLHTPLQGEGGADLVGDPPIFGVPAVGIPALHDWFSEMLAGFRQSGVTDPFSSPISRMALEFTRLVDRGEIAPADLEELVRHITADAFIDRARRLAAYVGETSLLANEERLSELFTRRIQPDANGPVLPFDEFQKWVEVWHFGIVFTAHPTFAMPDAQYRTLARLATSEIGDAEKLALVQARHRPPETITLESEFNLATEAAAQARDALERVFGVLLRVAQRFYPKQWTTLSPRLVSIASWVGFDHDGRSDIGWTDTLRLRLRIKLAQLARIRDYCVALRRVYASSKAVSTIELLESILTLAAKQVEMQIEVADGLPGSVESARIFADRLVAGRDHALTDIDRIVELLTRAIDAAEEPDLILQLVILRATTASHGLSLVHIHFRLNSTQLHNAIRQQLGMEGSPDDPSRRRSYVNAMNELLDTVEPASVNLGSLLAEKTSAKRMFMMIAQLAKHIDAKTPVRFLIAETETAFTLLVALYFARLFGVDHLVEISPLFETEEALEHGDAVIDEALRSRHFRAYIEKQGRLCVQFGYSDSGRYIGQMAATYWIERLRFKIAAVLKRHGLTGVQVVLFDTHGESVGRGAHPGSLVDRLLYLAPPTSRAALLATGATVKEESSFQGGDGFLHFLSPELAFASVSRIVETALAPPAESDDPIYADPDFASEFFAVVRQEFSQIVADRDYGALLSAFGPNMLDRSGSRPVKRQHELRAGPQELFHPSQIRAISNNGILQQLGFLANTIAGLGRAAQRNPERFRFMLQNSPRFCRALGLVERAVTLSDPDVLRGYVDLFDSGMWLNRSGRAGNPARREELRLVSAQLERDNLHSQLSRIFRRLQGDYLRLKDLLNGAEAKPQGGRDDLTLLHALRVAVIHRIYLLATHIPNFTPHRDLRREDVFQLILHLDVEEAVGLLREIFPRRDSSETAGVDFAEPASYMAGAGQTYERQHETIFEPMAANFVLLRRITAAITHHIGAVG